MAAGSCLFRSPHFGVFQVLTGIWRTEWRGSNGICQDDGQGGAPDHPGCVPESKKETAPFLSIPDSQTSPGSDKGPSPSCTVQSS